MSPPDRKPETPVADDLGFDLPEAAAVSKTRVFAFALGGVALMAVAFAVGYAPKHAQRVALEESTRVEGASSQRVEVITPKVGSSDRAIALPGSVQPLEETTIYARANGYVRKWYADIGDRVKDGQLLAELDTPELDQELDQARAQLSQAQAALVQTKASRDLSNTNLARYKQLSPSGVVSQAELDQRSAQAQVDEANVNVAQANVQAQEANIRRLVQLKGFARVTAPFAGTVTVRSVEIGTLVSAAAGAPLFKVAALDPARVFVQVPQDVAPSIRTDVPATVTVREYAARAFTGKVARAAGELDPMSRTMTTEVRVPNPDGALLPGMYADVAITLPAPHRVLVLPATAVSSDAKGVRVAIVEGDDHVKLVPVVVERDTGSTIEIASGLDPAARVVKIASSQLVDGKLVEPYTESHDAGETATKK
jgi:membrane fusion protein (multidrug efflux system)